jgi:hypothetical protein
VAAALARLAKRRVASAAAAAAAGGDVTIGQHGAGPASPEALAAEVRARRAELAKIEGLGAKISEELDAMDQRRAEGESEAAALSGLGTVRGAAEARAGVLQAQRDELAGARDSVQVGIWQRAEG